MITTVKDSFIDGLTKYLHCNCGNPLRVSLENHSLSIDSDYKSYLKIAAKCSVCHKITIYSYDFSYLGSITQ